MADLRSRGGARWAWGVLAVLVLLGAFLRLWRLTVLPPGLRYDEAINGFDTRMLLSGVGFPVYFAANNGREPLFIYLQAISVALLGSTPFALRIVSALVGIVTIPVTYFCALIFIRSERADSECSVRDPSVLWAALIATATITISYWHVSLSRIGFRAILLPLVGALAFAFFWRAWTGGRRRDYVWSGVCLGLALYTYTAARLLPMVLVAFISIEVLLDGGRIAMRSGSDRHAFWLVWRRRVAGLGLLLGISALVAIPLGIAAASEPDLVMGRSMGLSVISDAVRQGMSPSAVWLRLIENVISVARNFYDKGDQNLAYNLPGRPANDPLLAGLFTLGLVTLLWQVKRPSHRLLAIWFGVMLVPTVLSFDAPNSLRAAGAIPPLALICALGAYTVLRWWPWHQTRRYVGLLLLCLVVVGSGALTIYDYFNRWSRDADLGEAFTVRHELAAEATAGMLVGRSDVYGVLMPHSLYQEPQLIFALGPITYRDALPAQVSDGGPGTTAFVVGSDGSLEEPMYLVWRDSQGLQAAPAEPLAPAEVASLSKARADGTLHRALLSPGQWPTVVSGTLPRGIRLRPRVIPNELDVRFANGLRLVGYDVQPEGSEPDGRPLGFKLTSFWRSDSQTKPGAAGVDAFLHLADASGVWQALRASLSENHLLAWSPVDRLVQDIHILSVPPQMPVGKAHFELGLYERFLRPGSTEFERVPIVDPQGRVAGDRVDFGAVMVGEPPPQADLSGLRPLGARFEDRIELVGWWARIDPENNSRLLVDLGWRAIDRSVTDYTAFVHLLDSNAQMLAQDDEPLGGPENSTSHWVPGETVRTTFALQVPPGSRAGDHKLRVGLYEPVSGRQLPLKQGKGNATADTGETYLILSPGK